jgi:hypothetical protein
VATLCSDHNLLFIHGQGTASTAIRHALRRELGGVEVPQPEIRDASGKVVVGRHAHLRILIHHGLIPAHHGLLVATTVRNPFDYLVSTWLKLRAANEGRLVRPDASGVPRRQAARRGASALPFHEWVVQRYRRPGLAGRFGVTGQDRFPQTLGATVVMRFESLDEDFASLLRRVGHDRPVHLEQVNVTEGRDRDYRRYYTAAARRTVERVWADDLARFGYRF